MFNQLTGANQHVGNFPGVTVDRKDGQIRRQENTMVVDLPGIYSLSPYTSEEIVSRKYFLDDRPRGIINIVEDSKDSILAMIGGVIAPIFAPLGFDDWRASTALLTGFMAKESVVSTMTVLLGGKWVLIVVVLQCAIAWLASFSVKCALMLF